jgi:hypothetical protein
MDPDITVNIQCVHVPFEPTPAAFDCKLLQRDVIISHLRRRSPCEIDIDWRENIPATKDCFGSPASQQDLVYVVMEHNPEFFEVPGAELVREFFGQGVTDGVGMPFALALHDLNWPAGVGEFRNQKVIGAHNGFFIYGSIFVLNNKHGPCAGPLRCAGSR